MIEQFPKTYEPQAYEQKTYEQWEKTGVFHAKIDRRKKPFSIILPLPNASDPMHIGHAMFVIEDILIRYHLMLGDPTLWLPGADHAGIETQFVFEKKLAKEGKSRFDFDRETLFKMLVDFVEKNRLTNKDQLKKLGFALDWDRYHYSMEPEIVERVLETFRKLHQDGLAYRGERIIQYCTKCGTTFSDLEVVYKEKEDKLYYLDYGLLQIATTRPETIFADVAVAINSGDKKKKLLLGKRATIPLINKEIPIIEDSLVDPKFGTGALKITPGHDVVDFEIGQRHGLETITVVDKNGRMINAPESYLGKTVVQARAAVLEDLESAGKLIKTEPLVHSVGHCYRCGTVIEPTILPQWFIKTKPLAEKALAAVKIGKTKIFPKKRFEKMYFDWMKNIRDWNVSRQIVWGPRIPVWYCLGCNDTVQLSFLSGNQEKVSALYRDIKDRYSLAEIDNGLQSLVAPEDAGYQLHPGPCEKCGNRSLLQETDTFDTWFLSGQWPVNTLKSQPGDFEYFYPTSVLDTLWDILFFWVGRMMMLGLYLTGEVPFKTVHLHARVVDKSGKKMSKSKDNVIDPLVMVNQYGADALRLALVLGVGPASDVSLSDEKVRGMRNFTNKLWNIGRFIYLGSQKGAPPEYKEKMPGLTREDKAVLSSLNRLIKETTWGIEGFRFGSAAEKLYQFVWHEFADIYIEQSKKRIQSGEITVLSVLYYVYTNCLKLLHPFMPFVTEAIWQQLPHKKKTLLITESWPKVK